MSNVYAAPGVDLSNANNEAEAETIPFALNGRIGRLRYLAYGVATYFLVSIAFGLLMVPLAMKGGDQAAMAGAFMPISIAVVVLALFAVIARRRLHDLGMSGWFVLCNFIPFVNLYFGLIMLFKRGDEGGNEYGPRPSPNTWGVKVLAFLLPVIMIIGIIAAVAIPKMQ